MEVSLKKEIKNKKIVLLTLPQKEYSQKITRLAKELAKNFKHPCYISFNKQVPALLKDFNKAQVNLTAFFFIDGVSQQEKEIKNCIFLKSPTALTQLGIVISQLDKLLHPDVLVVDSPIAFLTYLKERTVMQFLHSLVNKTRVGKSKIIFICLDTEMETNLIDSLRPLVDGVITF